MATNQNQNHSNSNGSTNGHSIDPNVQLIINDFLCSQLSIKGYEWTPIVESESDNSRIVSLSLAMRTKIGDALRCLGQSYVQIYEQELARMCERLEVIPSTAASIFESVSNELFMEGIKWSHIVTYLVFGSEYAFYCVHKGFPHLVNEVSHWMAAFVTNYLLQWINDHNGWEGVVEFAGETIGYGKRNGQWKIGLKDILCGAAGAIGIITLGFFLTSRT